jgi:hypothetical protein
MWCCTVETPACGGCCTGDVHQTRRHTSDSATHIKTQQYTLRPRQHTPISATHSTTLDHIHQTHTNLRDSRKSRTVTGTHSTKPQQHTPNSTTLDQTSATHQLVLTSILSSRNFSISAISIPQASCGRT